MSLLLHHWWTGYDTGTTVIPAEADVRVFVSDYAFDQYDIDVSISIVEQSLTAAPISQGRLYTPGTVY